MKKMIGLLGVLCMAAGLLSGCSSKITTQESEALDTPFAAEAVSYANDLIKAYGETVQVTYEEDGVYYPWDGKMSLDNISFAYCDAENEENIINLVLVANEDGTEVGDLYYFESNETREEKKEAGCRFLLERLQMSDADHDEDDLISLLKTKIAYKNDRYLFAYDKNKLSVFQE